jgi:hypothetical protein
MKHLKKIFENNKSYLLKTDFEERFNGLKEDLGDLLLDLKDSGTEYEITKSILFSNYEFDGGEFNYAYFEDITYITSAIIKVVMYSDKIHADNNIFFDDGLLEYLNNVNIITNCIKTLRNMYKDDISIYFNSNELIVFYKLLKNDDMYLIAKYLESFFDFDDIDIDGRNIIVKENTNSAILKRDLKEKYPALIYEEINKIGENKFLIKDVKDDLIILSYS